MSASSTLAATLVFYLLGAVVLAAGYLRGRPGDSGDGSSRLSRWIAVGRTSAIAGAVAHMASIGLRCAELHRAPFATTGEALSLLAWMIVLAFVVVDIVWRLAAAGAFALGTAFLLVLLAGLQPDTGSAGATAPLLNERAVSLHIVAILGAFAAFVLAFSTAVLSLLERRILRSKHGLVWRKRLPPLGTLEKAGAILTSLGFPLLTLGILSGIVRASAGGMAAGWITDPKTAGAILLWWIYAAYLGSRTVLGWQGHRCAWILVTGMAACIGVLALPTDTHRFDTASARPAAGAGTIE